MTYTTRMSPPRMRHKSLNPFSFLHPAGRGLSASAKIFRSTRTNTASSRESNSFWTDCLISREYLATSARALQAGCAIVFVGDAFFLAPRFGDEAVPEILPNGPVLFQVDQNADLAAFLIG